MKVGWINNHKCSVITLHIVGLILCCAIAYFQIQLRWQLGYVVFWTTAISGLMFLLFTWERYWGNVFAKLYGFCWIPFSLIGLLVSWLLWHPAYCETDEYVMRTSKGFMGFETAVLYKKSGLQEIEMHRYELVYPEIIIPVDSLGAVVIIGDYPDGEGGCKRGTAIYPMNDDLYYKNYRQSQEICQTKEYRD